MGLQWHLKKSVGFLFLAQLWPAVTFAACQHIAQLSILSLFLSVFVVLDH